MKILTPFSPWRGRIDSEDGANGRRWHQCVHDASAYLESEMSLEKMADITGCPVIVGFACDEGVRRNKGRVGAVGGPSALRDALANLACVESFRVYDIGDINCVNGDLERSQHELAEVISQLLGHKLWPIVLGGGHEVGWASFYGIHQYFAKKRMKTNVGIINFDAHFDLRSVSNGPSSGTPFRQCQNYCESEGLPFNYFVLGLNPSANTEALFNFFY